MQAIDVDWCLRCNIKTQDSEYCSVECRDGQQQQAYHASSSRLSSPSLTSFSSLDLSAPLLPSHHYDSDLQSEEWVGKGSSGVPAWVAQVPLGAPPQSCASSPAPSSPLSVRPRKSTSSARSTASSLGQASSRGQPIASSSTLKPSIPLSTRKIAPPRLFLHSSSPSSAHRAPSPAPSVCSPHTTSCTVLPHTHTPASPVRPILAPRPSLPSLTARSATASLSSLATPHTASRPPSFHPPSCAASVAGADDDDDDEGTPERPLKRSWVHAAVARVSAGVKQWAAADRSAYMPYSTVALPRAPKPEPEEHEKVTRPPAQAGSSASTQQPPKPSAPIPKPQTRHRAPEPVSFFPLQDELVRAPVTEKPKPVRMGRAVVHPRVASQAQLATHLAPLRATEVRYEAAWGARGRRAQRAERTFGDAQ